MVQNKFTMNRDYKNILALIPEQMYSNLKVIDGNLELEEDLGITGDDADIFLNKFSQEFNVDINEFRVADFFDSEFEGGFKNLLRFLFKNAFRKSQDRRITLGDLAEAIETGKL